MSPDPYSDIAFERFAQDQKWGQQNHPNGTGSEGFHAHIVGVADRYRSECQQAFAENRGTYRHIFLEEVFEAVAEEDPEKLRAELIQCAAVAVAWVEKIDRDAEAAS